MGSSLFPQAAWPSMAFGLKANLGQPLCLWLSWKLGSSHRQQPASAIFSLSWSDMSRQICQFYIFGRLWRVEMLLHQRLTTRGFDPTKSKGQNMSRWSRLPLMHRKCTVVLVVQNQHKKQQETPGRNISNKQNCCIFVGLCWGQLQHAPTKNQEQPTGYDWAKESAT